MLLGGRGAGCEQCCAAEEEEFHASSFHCSIGGCARLRCSISDQNACSACSKLARCWFLAFAPESRASVCRTLAGWGRPYFCKICNKTISASRRVGLATFLLRYSAALGARLGLEHFARPAKRTQQTWHRLMSSVSPAALLSGRPRKSAAPA